MDDLVQLIVNAILFLCFVIIGTLIGVALVSVIIMNPFLGIALVFGLMIAALFSI